MKRNHQQAIQSQFDKRAKDYNSYTSWLKSNPLFEAITLPLKDLVNNAYCLDIGGGTGFIASKDIETSERQWVICDLSGDMGKQIIKSKSITFVKGDAHDLPFENNSFHFVLIRSLLYYVDIDRVISEAHRVLKFGGYLVIAEKIFSKKHIYVDEYKRLVNLRNPLKINVPETDDITLSLTNNEFCFLTLKRIEETYTQNLDTYLSRSNTAPVENRQEVMRILEKFSASNLGTKLNGDGTLNFTLNWEIFYSRKDPCIPNHTPIVVSMIVERKIKGARCILLQKRKNIVMEPEFFGYWEIPQGKVESGENIQQAVIRELKEETNLDFGRFKSHFKKNVLERNNIESFEVNNCVSISGRLNYISLCLVITATGTPQSLTIDSNPQWVCVDDIDLILKKGKVFPLNKPMLRHYLGTVR